MTLKGTGRATVDWDSIDLVPNTTLVIPAQATRQVVNTGEEGPGNPGHQELGAPSGKNMMEVMRSML